MLVICYPMLKYYVEYQDLGVDYFERGTPSISGTIWSLAWNHSVTK